jgi:parallel beta-helix repeat protein
MNDTSNESRGILISNSNNVSLINNVANKNYIGIEVLESNGNVIINNTANLNFLYGLSARSDGNLIIGNSLSSNSNGLFISGNNNIVDRNIISSNLNVGAILVSANFNRLNSNNVYRNGIDGIFLSFSANNTLIDNNISDSGRNGVWVNSSSNNLVDSNSVNYNLGYGISLVEGSDYNNITRNKVGGNTFGAIYDSEGNIGNLIMDNVEIFYPESCRNGIIDFNEEGVDCGGSCPACQTNVRVLDNLELSLGVSELMGKNDRIRFSFNSLTYDLGLIDLYENSANFIFDYNSSFNLSIGERVRIDIDEDNVFDILLFLFSLNSSNAEIFMQIISEPVLPEEPQTFEEPQHEQQLPQEGNDRVFDGFIPQMQQSSSQDDAEEVSSVEERTFLEENSFILLAFGAMILLLVIVIVIWLKTLDME